METKASTSLIQMSGTLQNSEERIKNDPLAKTIISIMSAMRADYGRVFTKQFSDEEVITLFKRRLYQKLKGLSIDAIVEGYERCIERNTKFCPTVPEIVASVLDVVKQHKKSDENKAESERISALPSPTISCNPIEMLAKAKIKDVSNNEVSEESSEERMKRRAEMLKNHEALLVIHGENIKRRYAGPEHSCEYSGCQKAGSISRAISGKGNFYCSEHYRMA